MKHASAAKLLETLVADSTLIRRKVTTSISEYNYRLKGLSVIEDDDLYFFYVNLLPLDTDLILPKKISTVMRNVKVAAKRKVISARKTFAGMKRAVDERNRITSTGE